MTLNIKMFSETKYLFCKWLPCLLKEASLSGLLTTAISFAVQGIHVAKPSVNFVLALKCPLKLSMIAAQFEVFIATFRLVQRGRTVETFAKGAEPLLTRVRW